MESVPREKVSDLLITRTAIKTLTSESVVEKIISFQGKDASKAVKEYDEVEFSGFGKFLRSQKKTLKKIQRLEEGIEKVQNKLKVEEDPDLMIVFSRKLIGMEEHLEYHKTKLHEQDKGVDKTSPRGGEEYREGD